MSNKTIAILLGILLVLASYTLFQRAQTRAQKTQLTPAKLSSIKDAFESGMSIQCTHENDDGIVNIYIKDGALRYDNTLPKYKGTVRHYIYRNGVTYIWTNDTGITYRDVNKRNYDDASPLFMNTNEALAVLEEFKNSCSISRFEDTIFNTPQNVGFMEVKTNAEAGLLPKKL